MLLRCPLTGVVPLNPWDDAALPGQAPAETFAVVGELRPRFSAQVRNGAVGV